MEVEEVGDGSRLSNDWLESLTESFHPGSVIGAIRQSTDEAYIMSTFKADGFSMASEVHQREALNR